MSSFGGSSGTFTGLMQIVGGWLESIARTPVGFRVRTAAGSEARLSHNDTDATLQSTVGKLKLVAANSIETAQPISAGAITSSGAISGTTITGTGAVVGVGIFDGITRIPAPSTGNTASRPVAPVLAQEYFDTDLDDWIKWSGAGWRKLTGVDA